MTMPLLNIILLVTFMSFIHLHESSNGVNRCLTVDRHGNCSCCKSGFRGQTCNDICEHCLSRLGAEQSCIYYCKTGYYGKTCDKPCPTTCAPGINGKPLCTENNGLPVCVRCDPRSYGKQCDQICHTNCLNRKCHKADGHCLNCSSTEFYGDHCRLRCSQGCVSGTCNRTGHCTNGCKFGSYGERCESFCGSNCQQGKCTSHGIHAYSCTEGCHDGYWGITCLEKCPNHCTQCEQQSGRCTLCVENYDQKPETGECEKVADWSNLIIIVIVVSVVIIISGIIIVVIWKKRRHRQRDSSARNAEEDGLLSDNNKQQEQIPLQPVNQGGEGVRNADLVDLQIKDMQETFIDTSIYNLVEEKLKTNGHVTISGASGEGKTSMALMLGNAYKKKGYQLVFVTDLFKFNMEIVKGRKIFYIFDDMFRAERLSDTSKLKEILLFAELYLKQAKEMAHQADNMEDNDSAKQQEKEEFKFMVVFTSKTYNLTSGMSKLPECKHFMYSSIVDVTAGDGYSKSDMELIFLKHKQKHNITENMPVEKICNLKMLTFGFPLLCMMFFQLLYSKGIDVLEFFREPIAFLELEMKSIIKLKNEESAALLLMMLCEDGLNVLHLENKSDDTVLEKRVKKVQNLMNSLNRTDISEAARGFQGTYFTKGDIMYFSHPSISSACAFVIFDIYPTFLLRNGSIKFVYERIHPVLSDLTMIDRETNTILISPQNYVIIIERLAEEIKKGEYSMTIAHPILRNKDVVDKLFIELNSPSVYFHEQNNNKCFLHWAVHAKSLYLIQKILRIETNFSPEEIQQACEACAKIGNTLVLNFLFKNLASTITDTVVMNVALAVAYTGNSEMFKSLPLNGQNPNLSLSLTSQGHNMLHAACIGGSKKIVESVSQWIDIDSQDRHGQTAIMLAAISGMDEVVTFLNKNGANLAHTDKKGNTAFHLACQVGKICIVQYLLPLCDINSRGENGRTPAMNAAVYGKKEVFDLLVSKGADLTLTDNYEKNLLHHACQGGNTSIVEKVLPLFKIDIRGQIDRTAVMIAAHSGKKEVFDLLVTKAADLTLTDSDENNLLHHACRGGNTSIVEQLLPSFDINSRGQIDWTPAMIAAYSGKKEVFDLLVTKGADLTLTDSYENNLLHHACRGGNTSIVEHLLPLFDTNSRGENGRTPVMNAAVSAKKEVFDLLVTKEADLTLTDNYENNLLHQACRGGNTSIVEQLLPLFDINSRGQIGWTPVMIAAYRGKKEVFDLLVTKGADLTLTDSYGNFVLHLACRGGNTSIVEHLLPSFDINSRGENGWTLVINAAYIGKKEVFDLLVTAGADLTLTDNYGDSVLHHACRGGNTSIVEHLLPSTDINSRGQNGWTPVMNAAFSGKKEVFDLLVTKGADLTLTDSYGNSVLHLACRGGNTSIVEHLLPSFDINSRGQNGWTPVMNAAFSGKKEIFDLLVTKGADLTATDSNGHDILHLACAAGNIETVRNTLPMYDVNAKGWNSRTPLMMAVSESHIDVVDFLLSNNADVNLVDDDGDSLLHLACESGNLAMVKHVLPFSDIHLRDKLGLTPLMLAVLNGKLNVLQYLVDKGASLEGVDNVGDDVLTLAYRGGCKEIIQQLTPCGEEIQRIEKWTELMHHVAFGHWKVLKETQQDSPELLQRDGFGDTLLHLACRGGNLQCVEYLLPLHDINVRGQHGWTPVMMAARCGHMDALQCLISLKADLSLISDTGEDVLCLARRGKHTDIVTFLLTLPDFSDTG